MQIEAEAPAREPLSLQRVTRRYPRVTALAGIDLTVRRHEVLAVVGPSGCGKSTLLELMAGLQEPDEGTVSARGATDAAGRRAACAYMPQRDLLLPWRDALANAALALECQGVPRSEARRRAEPLFDRFGLADFERAQPSELSGGMRQRVAFLRTVLLVTHDVEEALFLADRVAVLSQRPGRVVAEIDVDLPRPREVTSAEFGALKRRALEALGL
jgi:ABC-type nitrate/sulfonate/bicarbonate transport system ATPase subunit